MAFTILKRLTICHGPTSNEVPNIMIQLSQSTQCTFIKLCVGILLQNLYIYSLVRVKLNKSIYSFPNEIQFFLTTYNIHLVQSQITRISWNCKHDSFHDCNEAPFSLQWCYFLTFTQSKNCQVSISNKSIRGQISRLLMADIVCF